jgi:hypothetical protein
MRNKYLNIVDEIILSSRKTQEITTDYSRQAVATKKENNMGLSLSINDIKPGDKLHIERDVEVSSVDRFDGTFRTKDNRTVRVSDKWGNGNPVFTVSLITREKEAKAETANPGFPLKVSFKDLKVGDKVRIYKDVTVAELGLEGFYDEKSFWYSDLSKWPRERDAHHVQLLERPKPNYPQHWPPQDGDVWRGKDGNEYHVISGVVRSYTGGTETVDNLLSAFPVLLYRKGNILR